MPYDQSWMGYGAVGGLEAGAIAAAAGLLALALVYGLGRKQAWSHGRKISLAYVASVLLAGGRDMWNLFYVNFGLGQMQSLQLLQAELTQIHDPDSIGLRVFCILVGAAVGVGLGMGVGYLYLARPRSAP